MENWQSASVSHFSEASFLIRLSADKINFYTADIQENTYIAATYDTSSLPCFLFIKDGKEVTRQIGKDEEALTAKVEALYVTFVSHTGH